MGIENEIESCFFIKKEKKWIKIIIVERHAFDSK